MGNLYTHIVKHHSQKLDILRELKYYFRCTPLNWEKIHELRKRLKLIESPKPNQKPFIKSIFGKRQGS